MIFWACIYRELLKLTDLIKKFLEIFSAKFDSELVWYIMKNFAFCTIRLKESLEFVQIEKQLLASLTNHPFLCLFLLAKAWKLRKKRSKQPVWSMAIEIFTHEKRSMTNTLTKYDRINQLLFPFSFALKPKKNAPNSIFNLCHFRYWHWHSVEILRPQ